MRVTRLFPLALVGLTAAAVARCSGGGGDAGETARCEIDLAPYLAAGGSGAYAKVAGGQDLLKGEAAQGRPGDTLIANDRIKVLIEAPGRVIGAVPYGGNIIDADIVREGGETKDAFGEMGSLFQFGRTVNVERVEILKDGANGGPAVVAATGRDTILDFINLPGLLASAGMSSLVQLPNPDPDMGMRITKYYVLNPGSSSVKVVDAFCNDTKAEQYFGVGDLVDAGGNLEIYAGDSGFQGGGGDIGSVAAGLSGADERFFAWMGADVSYGYLPETDRNQGLVISGVTVSLLGGESLLSWAQEDDIPEGALIVEPGKSAVVVRDFVVAAEPGGIYSAYYAKKGAARGTLSGMVTVPGGNPAAGARVVVKDAASGKVVSLFTTDAQGRFSGEVPKGSLIAWADDAVAPSAEVAVTLDVGGKNELELTLGERGKLVAHVRDENGAPLPGKVTVLCKAACPGRDAKAGLARDVRADSLPRVEGVGEAFDIRYLGPEGDAELRLPAGEYKVYISRGPEYSLYGEDITVAANATVTVEGRIKRVARADGWMSGDFHVHAINSPDSMVPNDERLRSFMAEGVDVIVATDHDFITDYAPVLAAIPNGTKYLRSIAGLEVTTFDYGHYNGFPVHADTTKRNGGAIDWASGKRQAMTPGDIFKAIRELPGDGEERVVQINHARSLALGAFTAAGLDTRTFWTSESGDIHRIRPVKPDPVTRDTRLFDPNFTAIEIQNGLGDSGIFPLANDWMSMLSRGLRKTATAVSDTHKLHGDAGYPRTYVKVGTNNPQALDVPAYVRAINEGRAVGTNGPMVFVKAKANGKTAEPGDTLESGGGKVTVEVEVKSPAWLEVSKARIFINAKGTETSASGVVPKNLPEPAEALDLLVQQEGDAGFEVNVASASTEVDVPKDAWIVVVVTGTKDMFPVVGKGGEKAFAFTNAIYVDVDGNGWIPPIDLAAERRLVGALPEKAEQALSAPLTEWELREVLRNHTH